MMSELIPWFVISFLLIAMMASSCCERLTWIFILAAEMGE